MQNQLEILASYLRNKDFGDFYDGIAGVIDEIYAIGGEDPVRLIKLLPIWDRTCWTPGVCMATAETYQNCSRLMRY